MDILNTLKQKGKELYIEELEYYITELNTGDYSEIYVKECFDLINNIINWNKSQISQEKKETKKPDEVFDILIDPSKLIKGYEDPKKKNFSNEEKVKFEIEEIRKKSNYNELFLKYINENNFLDENMIDFLFKFFMTWELEEMLVYRKFSENFLEKYFSELDHSKIARYQYFSEEFFIRHFKDLSYSTVLQKGVNEWRKKSERSSKLDLFLRLKGVTI